MSPMPHAEATGHGFVPAGPAVPLACRAIDVGATESYAYRASTASEDGTDAAPPMSQTQSFAHRAGLASGDRAESERPVPHTQLVCHNLTCAGPVTACASGAGQVGGTQSAFDRVGCAAGVLTTSAGPVPVAKPVR